MLSRRDSLQIVRTWSESSRIEKYIPCKGEQRRVRAGLTDRWILKLTVKRDKDGCYIIIKGSTQEEDVTFVNFNRLKVRNSNTINSGDFNAPITSVHRPSRPKIHKETLALDDNVRSHKCNRHTYNVLHKSSGIHILKCTRNIPEVNHIFGHKTNFFCATSHGSWDLSSGPGIEPGSSEVKVWLPNHWTTRKFTRQVLINFIRLKCYQTSLISMMEWK